MNMTVDVRCTWSVGRSQLPAGTLLSRDGLACFMAVTDAGCIHLPAVVGELKSCDLLEFEPVNTGHGDLKITLAAAFYALSHGKYGEPQVAPDTASRNHGILA